MKVIKTRDGIYDDMFKGKTIEFCVGQDCNGDPVYEGDIVKDVDTDDCYRVRLGVKLEKIPADEVLDNFELMEEV